MAYRKVQYLIGTIHYNYSIRKALQDTTNEGSYRGYLCEVVFDVCAVVTDFKVRELKEKQLVIA